MDSETDFPSDSNYNEFANEIPYLGDMLQLFQVECVFSQLLKHKLNDLAGTGASGGDWLLHHRD